MPLTGFETWTSGVKATALPTEPQPLPIIKTCLPSSGILFPSFVYLFTNAHLPTKRNKFWKEVSLQNVEKKCWLTTKKSKATTTTSKDNFLANLIQIQRLVCQTWRQDSSQVSSFKILNQNLYAKRKRRENEISSIRAGTATSAQGKRVTPPIPFVFYLFF